MTNIFQYLKNNQSLKVTTILLIGTLLTPTHAQHVPGNKSAPFSRFDEFKAMLQNKMESTRTPSISIAVAKNGNIVWEQSFGWANKGKKIKATPRTIYSLASISKPMTATAMMILAERGLIDLNKSVDSYLGGDRLTVFEGNTADVTVTRLLHHTAGLPVI